MSTHDDQKDADVYVVVQRTIAAPAQQLFDVVANPRRHAEIDGSDTLRKLVTGPLRLSMGAKFGMRMHWWLPYVVRNTVVEFVDGRSIAWRHLHHHVWRYEFEPIDDTHTLVSESFDGRPARSPEALRKIGAPARNRVSMERTLEALERVVLGTQQQLD
jgi:uncharacterized protein YndB with AHSA1/START domain